MFKRTCRKEGCPDGEKAMSTEKEFSVYAEPRHKASAFLAECITPTQQCARFGVGLEVAKYFKVSKRDAKETVQDFADTISKRWDIYESDYGISKSE